MRVWAKEAPVLREPLLMDFNLVKLPDGRVAEVQTADYEEVGGAVETRLTGGGYGRLVWESDSWADGLWLHGLVVASVRAGLSPDALAGRPRPSQVTAIGVYQIHRRGEAAA